MNEVDDRSYITAFALGLGGGVTLERFRAPRGGLHKIRVVHHDSMISVEREYDDAEAVFSVQNELIMKLQSKLAEEGWAWVPGTI